MDARWNWVIDNVALRAVINTAAFALWIAVAVGILDLAAKF